MQSELETAIKAVKIAAQQISAITSPSIWQKENGEVVTTADISSNDAIISCLFKHFPDYGLLCEEEISSSLKDYEQIIKKRVGWGKNNLVWVVDGLDGTADYEKGLNEYGILIGLMDAKGPKIGISYFPIKDELYFAVRGKGAYLIKEGHKKKLEINPGSTRTILKSYRQNEPKLNKILTDNNEILIKSAVGTGQKLCMIANNEADAYICFNSEKKVKLWDALPGILIVKEAGGITTDIMGNKMEYNKINLPAFVASNEKLHAHMLKLAKYSIAN